jgi:hypothetical protein
VNLLITTLASVEAAATIIARRLSRKPSASSWELQTPPKTARGSTSRSSSRSIPEWAGGHYTPMRYDLIHLMIFH